MIAPVAAAWIIFDKLADSPEHAINAPEATPLILPGTVFANQPHLFNQAIFRLVAANMLTRPDIDVRGRVAFKRQLMCHAWPVVKADWLFKDAHEAALKLVRQDFARLAIEESKLAIEESKLAVDKSKLAVEAQTLEAQKRRNEADILDADARIAKRTKAKHWDFWQR